MPEATSSAGGPDTGAEGAVCGERARLPWWEFDRSEKPVPLEADGEWGVDDKVAVTVACRPERMTSHDTEPTLQGVLSEAGPAGQSQPTRHAPGVALEVKSARRPALALLAASCVGMCVLGLTHGASARHRAMNPRRGSPEAAKWATSQVQTQERASLRGSLLVTRSCPRQGR